MKHDFYKLKVVQVVDETDDSKSIYFQIPDELKNEFKYKAGQYLTLKFLIDQEEHRRSYSLCTSPHEGKWAVNVKRVSKGLISNYINDHVKNDDIIEVMNPDGKFVNEVDETARRNHFFFAAGSGITPIISIIKDVLENEPKSNCYLLYGNKDEKSIIFHEELKELAKKYEGQLSLHITLSKPLRKKSTGVKGLFSRGKISWEGMTGRINGEKIESLLKLADDNSKENQYYVCGPGAMIDTIIDYLETKGVESQFLHTEHFVSSAPPMGSTSGVVKSLVKVHLSGKSYEVEVPEDKTILEQLIDSKIDPPYSCTSGACSTCVAKVSTGKVSMDACYALDEGEIRQGYILTCQSRALTPQIELTFE